MFRTKKEQKEFISLGTDVHTFGEVELHSTYIVYFKVTYSILCIIQATNPVYIDSKDRT